MYEICIAAIVIQTVRSSSVKPLPIHGFACNERIFHEVRVEIHTRMCTFCDGFLHQIIALPVLKASGSFLSFKLQLCGTDNNTFFQNNFIVLACLASEKKKKKEKNISARQMEQLLVSSFVCKNY